MAKWNDDLLAEICQSLSNLENSDKITKLVNEALNQNVPITDIIERGLRKGLEEVGKRYESGEYFLSELLFSASLVNEVMLILEPHLKEVKPKKLGSIVLGTVKGDIHDIGKNIFKMFAQASGFEVYDLGVDVDVQKFIEKLEQTEAEILALSALLTTTRNYMKVVIDAIIQKGMRKNLKILLGGNAVDKKFAEEIGADAAAIDAIEGIEICKRWISEEA
jgi:5-methyltetrahydrofolate--homocysteine methyltransferase